MDGMRLWELYSDGKQTVAEISAASGLSASTIKRRLRKIEIGWHQPLVSGSGVVHLDATYFGRNCGVLVALEGQSGRLLYMKQILHEHIGDYEEAVNHIVSQGYTIRGIVIDGQRKLFTVFAGYPVQMCHFHMVAIVRRKLTKNPQLPAGQELLRLVYRIKSMTAGAFTAEFLGWKSRWHDFLSERTTNPLTGRTIFTHQRLRSAMASLSFYLKWLFTYETVDGMASTNNMLEGTFTELKNKIRVHAGMTEANRRRFVNGFFLAYARLHNEKGETP